MDTESNGVASSHETDLLIARMHAANIAAALSAGIDVPLEVVDRVVARLCGASDARWLEAGR